MIAVVQSVQPFNVLIKLHSNTVIGTLAVDGWAVTFATARRGLGGLRPCPVPSSLYQMKQPTRQRPLRSLTF